MLSKLSPLGVMLIFIMFGLVTEAHSEQLTKGNHNNVEVFQFSSIENQQRAYYLARHLRCPKCQNQNLMESNASIAVDMKYQVFVMIEQGRSDEEIMNFMQTRFGDFVLYNPKFELSTAFLWFAPIVLFVLLILMAKRLTKER